MTPINGITDTYLPIKKALQNASKTLHFTHAVLLRHSTVKKQKTKPFLNH